MGQYFKAVNFNKSHHLHPHESNNGLKLMEHSYIGNEVTNAIEHLLLGEWGGDQIVWAGDYAEREDEPSHPEDDESSDGTLYDTTWNIPYNHLHTDTNVRYFVNLKKLEYVDKQDAITMSYGHRIHPLPLLTASSNGRGGGDYRGEAGIEFVGSWCGHPIIAVEDTEESLLKITQGAYTKINPGFTEE